MRHLTRLAAVLAAGTLIATIPGAASAAPDDRSANWLGRQLTDGLVVGSYQDTWTDPENPTWVEYNDHGLTADTAYALKKIGGHGKDLRAIRSALADNVDSWTTGGSKDVYSGSVAKALVVAQVTRADPRDFGGVNLVKRLNRRVSGAAPTVGRVEDKTSSTDYANTIGQAFAARGLARAGSSEADEALRFLLKQQCQDGFFRLSFAAKDAKKQGCDAGNAADSSPDTDVTALAVLQLDALPKKAKTRAVKRAIAHAAVWLKTAQKKNGSLGGGTATEASNANSTGLAAWALGETGSCAKARKAAKWVRDLQVSGDVSGSPLAGEKGAIAYDRTAYRMAAQNGITSEDQDQWRRATTQAAPGLRYLTCG